ncbi:MAG: hypothetical protein ACRDPJ_09895 [Nocardioidaceae bacterium]
MSERSWGLTVVALVALFVLLAAPGLWQASVGLAAAVMAAFAVHRRRQVKAWQHELDVAFEVGQRPEISAHRTL